MADRPRAARLQSLEPFEWQSPADVDCRVQERALLMTPVRTLFAFRSYLRNFARDRGAVAAVEFAIILPLMLIIYLGGVELGDGMAIQYKVTETARTVTDLGSQYTSINTATMSSILGASSTVVAPYSSAGMTVT